MTEDMGNARLQSFIERIERLEEDKAAIATDIKEVYSEAKFTGFDPAIMRKIVAIRKKDGNAVAEEMALLRAYMQELGMQMDMFDG